MSIRNEENIGITPTLRRIINYAVAVLNIRYGGCTRTTGDGRITLTAGDRKRDVKITFTAVIHG